MVRKSGLITGVVAATALVVSGCAGEVAGAPHKAQQAVAAGVYLTQQVNVGDSPRTYDGVPTFDPCSILTMRLVQDAGYQLDPQNEYHDDHFAANGDHGTTNDAKGSPEPASLCSIWPKDGDDARSENFVSLEVDQLPFQDTHDRDITMNLAQAEFLDANHEKLLNSETHGDMRIYTIQTDQPHEFRVMYFFGGNQYWATMMVYTGGGDVAKPEEEVLRFLTDQVEQKLAAGPASAGQSSLKYDAPYSVPQPCAIYQAQDFPASFNEPELGRVKEVYQLGERVLTASDGDSGSWKYVRTSCARTNHAFVGDEKQQQLTVEVDTYDDPSGATYSNTYDCSGDPKYQQPFGQPIKINEKIGDGYLCFIQTGQGQNPDLSFRVGRHVVRILSFSTDPFTDPNTANTVFEATSRNIADRLAQYK